MVWRGGDPRPVPLIPAVAGLTAVGTLMDEDEDAEEKRRRMEAKIAAENFGAAIGFAAGAAMAVKEKLDEHAAREERTPPGWDVNICKWATTWKFISRRRMSASSLSTMA